MLCQIWGIKIPCNITCCWTYPLFLLAAGFAISIRGEPNLSCDFVGVLVSHGEVDVKWVDLNNLSNSPRISSSCDLWKLIHTVFSMNLKSKNLNILIISNFVLCTVLCTVQNSLPSDKVWFMWVKHWIVYDLIKFCLPL